MRISDWSSDVCSSDLGGRAAQQCQLELHARDRGPEVVGDAGEQLGALLNLPPDALAHHQERGRGLLDLDRPADAEAFDVPALAESVRGGGEADDQPDLLAHENAGDRDQHQRRSEEHTSELQSLMRNSYAVFCLKKK